MTTTPVVWLTHKLVGEFIERANKSLRAGEWSWARMVRS